MIRGFLTRRAEWPARIPDPDAMPPLKLLWREIGSLARAMSGRIRPMPPEPNPDSAHPPVMVLPGFLSGDWATKALRGDLRRAGFRCYAWGLGFNRGATPDIIERIDTLTGGASAVYGSDAVAGVVNFVYKTKFDGVQLDFEARWIAPMVWLVDNRIVDRQPGYDVVIAVEDIADVRAAGSTGAAPRAALVNLGWIAAAGGRDALPVPAIRRPLTRTRVASAPRPRRLTPVA